MSSKWPSTFNGGSVIYPSLVFVGRLVYPINAFAGAWRRSGQHNHIGINEQLLRWRVDRQSLFNDQQSGFSLRACARMGRPCENLALAGRVRSSEHRLDDLSRYAGNRMGVVYLERQG